VHKHTLTKYTAQAAAFLEARRATTPAGMVMRLAGVQGLAERAQTELDQVLARIDSVSAAALEQNRDLSDQDRETIKLGRDRADFLREQLESLAVDVTLSERATTAFRSNARTGGQASPTAFRSAGDALHTMLHAGRDTQLRQRYDVEMNRAAQHMGADASNTVPVAGGLGALVVKPVVGPVIDLSPRGRPFLTALGVQQLDTPLGFSRPRIVDEKGNEAPAPQGKEKSELVSRAFDVKLDSIDSETIGEYLNISQKLLSLPIGALNMVTDRFSVRRAQLTERRAILEVLETESVVPLVAATDDEDSGAIWDAVWEAALLVYQNTKAMPAGIAMGPLGWARLGKLRDKAGRPLFPRLGAVNAMGSMDATTLTSEGPAGLPAVVTPGITGPEFVVYNSTGLEAYEFQYPMLESVEASVLGRQVAMASELAFYRPATEETAGSRANTGNAAGNGAVKIVPPGA
jgi:HK97 family phage major capsid protein